jgi:hypothetical protein
MRRLPIRLGSLLAAGAVLAAAHVPSLAAALPVLDILRGPLGVVLAVLAILASVAGEPRDRLGPLLRRTVPAPILFAVGFLLLAGVGVYYTGRLRVSGDEPHYLLMAQSLWRDGDLDLRDNIARGETKEYTPADLRPHWGAPRADGRPFPAHSVGLPALLAPAYALGGRRACVILLAALGAGLALLSRTLAFRATGDEAASQLAWLVTLGPPAAFYAFHIYTELPAAFAIAAPLVLLLKTPAPRAAAAIVAAAMVSTLPWLHVKMVPVAAALGVIAIVRLRGRARLSFLSVAVLAALGYVAFFESVFGRPTPLAVYGGHLPPQVSGAPLRAAAGLLLDRSFGLLPHAPAFLLALAAVPLAVRRPLRETWPYALVLAAVLAPVLSWRMWWGGQCPPGRFLVPLLPILGPLVALRAARDPQLPRGLLRWRAALVGIGFALVAFMTYDPGRLMLLNRRNRPTRLWAALSGEGDVGRYLPSLTHPDAPEVRVALLWLVALGLILVLDTLSRSRAWANRAFGGMGLPLAALLLVGAGVDYWARVGGPDSGEVSVGRPRIAFFSSEVRSGERPDIEGSASAFDVPRFGAGHPAHGPPHPQPFGRVASTVTAELERHPEGITVVMYSRSSRHMAGSERRPPATSRRSTGDTSRCRTAEPCRYPTDGRGSGRRSSSSPP